MDVVAVVAIMQAALKSERSTPTNLLTTIAIKSPKEVNKGIL
jgi:hypothetical protein